MWASIRTIEEVRASYDGALKGSLREQLINLGAIHGFSETELIQHGIITPRANPNHEGGR
jgi:hypothetical protein